jgi:hypothetical protein
MNKFFCICTGNKILIKHACNDGVNAATRAKSDCSFANYSSGGEVLKLVSI